MASSNKVTVKIYGQEYTIAGDKSREQIIQVADRVDKTMRDIADVVGAISVSSLAVLTAINFADELFVNNTNVSDMELEHEQMKKDVDHYIQLWEEAKKNFLQYKEDAQAALEQKDKLQDIVNKKTIENDRLQKEVKDKDKQIDEFETKLASMNNRLKSRTEGQNVSVEQIKILEDRYKEIEGSYFELQMENIKLKGDLDKYRKDED